ncbi:MAG: NADH-quinone oxidoreductase subunit J [Elusimicrobiota bacterium]|jgi:NADH-quinone oxidoreductase subunit J
MSTIVFFTLSAVVLLSALGVVLLRNTLHSALLLGLCLAGVGGLYATLGADFLFGSQLLVYVGGIAVLMLFVVMLAGRASELRLRQVNDQWLAALLICGVTFWGMQRYIDAFAVVRATTPAQATTAPIGRLMLDRLALPFELISIILVAALVGAVVFSRPKAGRGS